MKNTLAHTAWECKYHVVWIPKNRRKVVYGKLKRDIGKIIRRLCEYKQIEVVEGTACADHIHMCLSIPPKYACFCHCWLPQRKEHNDFVREV
jgi:putative transposase